MVVLLVLVEAVVASRHAFVALVFRVVFAVRWVVLARPHQPPTRMQRQQ